MPRPLGVPFVILDSEQKLAALCSAVADGATERSVPFLYNDVRSSRNRCRSGNPGAPERPIDQQRGMGERLSGGVLPFQLYASDDRAPFLCPRHRYMIFLHFEEYIGMLRLNLER